MKNKSIAFFFRLAVFGLGLVAAVLQFLAGFLQFETGTHYFLRSALLPIMATVVACLGVCLAVATGFLDRERNAVKHFRLKLLPSALLFFALIPVLIISMNESSTVANRLTILAVILLFLASLSCLLSTFLDEQKYRGLLAIFSFFPVLAPASLAFVYYFDKSVEMNSPVKVLLQTACLFAMFFFLCETRRLLEKPIPRLLAGLRLAFFPMASLGASLIFSTFFSGAFRRVDYLFGGLFLLALQATLLFDLFPARN